MLVGALYVKFFSGLYVHMSDMFCLLCLLNVVESFGGVWKTFMIVQ